MSSPAPANQASEQLDLSALGQTRKPPADIDMTPEVSDIIAEMPWWAARGLLYIILGFVAVAALWAHFSQMDVVIEARGRLVPEGYVRPVQAAASGIVQYVRVREGELVSRGQVLLQLDAADLRGRLGKLRDELRTNEEQLRQLRAAKGLVTETLDRQNRLAQLKSEIADADSSLSHTTITAPLSGIITKLEVLSPRQVVQTGQLVAAIAPAGARLLIEAQVPNKDIAFIEKGLPVKLKFDAFPFQDYGTLPGTVIEVSPDAQVDERLGSFYKVMIAPERTEMTAKGKAVPLRPGLALAAEIITERKSVLSLILEPFYKLK
jgi:HlyD family secretion protein